MGRKIVVPGEGPVPCPIMLVAERPGHVEVQVGRPLVGPSGIELFGGEYEEKYSGWRLHMGLWDRMVGVPRSRLYITNLCKDFRGGDNPEPWEIETWEPTLLEELGAVQPQTIVAMGAYAARWFNPGFMADRDHGIPFSWNMKTRQPGNGDHSVTVIPCLHPAYALRVPDVQSAFAWDLRQVKRVLDGDPSLAEYLVRPLVVPVETFLDELPWRYSLSLDTEGTVEVPECVSLAWGHLATVVYADDRQGLLQVQKAIDHATTVIMHAAIGDLHVCRAIGLDIPRLEDTMLMARLVQEFESMHLQGLKPLAWRRLRLRMNEYEDLVNPIDRELVRSRLQQLAGDPSQPKKILTSIKKILEKETADTPRKRWSRSKVLGPIPQPPLATWLSVPRKPREQYAAIDPWATGMLARDLTDELKTKRLDHVYRINRGMLPMLARMEQVGVRVEGARLETLAIELAQEYDAICFRIMKMTGVDCNPNAPEDVSDLLFQKLGVTETKRTKGGKHFTTEDKYLEQRKHEHPVIPLIIKAREVKKHEGYCAGALEKAKDEGGVLVIHPDFRYTRVVSGRLAEWLLTIPKHSTFGKKIRQAFVARDGCVLLSMDMSQIELRAAAHLSQDPTMMKIYMEDKIDIHTNTAHAVLGAPPRKQDQDESLHRLPAKTTNFSILMGTTEYGLADSINEALAGAFAAKHGCIGEPGHNFKLWTPDDCRELINGWYRTYPGVADFNRQQLLHARRTGFVRDHWGRRRYVAGVYSHNRWIREAAERESQSFAYQASAQGLMHIWMGKIWRLDRVSHRYCEPWLQVHDDLLYEVDHQDVSQWANACLAALPQLWSIPVAAEAKYGLNWGHLTEAVK